MVDHAFNDNNGFMVDCSIVSVPSMAGLWTTLKILFSYSDIFVDAGMISDDDSVRPREISEEQLLTVHGEEYIQSLTVSKNT